MSSLVISCVTHKKGSTSSDFLAMENYVHVRDYSGTPRTILARETRAIVLITPLIRTHHSGFWSTNWFTWLRLSAKRRRLEEKKKKTEAEKTPRSVHEAINVIQIKIIIPGRNACSWIVGSFQMIQLRKYSRDFVHYLGEKKKKTVT